MRMFLATVALVSMAVGVYAASNLVGTINVPHANLTYTAASKQMTGNGAETLNVNVDISGAAHHVKAGNCSVTLSQIVVTGDGENIHKSLNGAKESCSKFANFTVPASLIWSDENASLSSRCKKKSSAPISLMRHVRVYYELTSGLGHANDYVTANASGSLTCM